MTLGGCCVELDTASEYPYSPSTNIDIQDVRISLMPADLLLLDLTTVILLLFSCLRTRGVKQEAKADLGIGEMV